MTVAMTVAGLVAKLVAAAGLAVAADMTAAAGANVGVGAVASVGLAVVVETTGNNVEVLGVYIEADDDKKDPQSNMSFLWNVTQEQ